MAEYWFVDDDAQRFECYRREGDRYSRPGLITRGGTVRSTALPGLEVTVDAVLGPGQEPPSCIG